MKTVKIFFSIFLVALGVTSCTEPLEVKLKSTNPQVSIFGRIDDNPFTMDKITVNKSVSYLHPADSIYIADAQVTVADESGNVWVFTYAGKGLYLPPSTYSGVALNATYTLKVVHDGKEYGASSTVIPFSPTNEKPLLGDSVDKKTKDNVFGTDTAGYRIWTLMKDYPGKKNYYYIDIARNDSLQFYIKDNPFVYIFDDTYFKLGFPAPIQFQYTFKENDKARIDLYSLDYTTYQFYSGLALQAGNTGSFFEAPGANVPGNISNGALGVFFASTSCSDTLTVRKK
jgi:hypothetical protein